jgi:hypothetical protein
MVTRGEKPFSKTAAELKWIDVFDWRNCFLAERAAYTNRHEVQDGISIQVYTVLSLEGR